MTGNKFKYFAIFGAMRTGSNLLERNLNQFEQILCHGELFNPGFIGKNGQQEYLDISLAERETNPERLIRKVINKSGDTLPGFRIFQGHDPRILSQALADPTCGKIILRRRPIDSFVSLKIARATDQWILGNAPMRRTTTIHFDLEEYRDYLSRLSEFDRTLRMGLQEAGQTAFEIRYEDLKSPAILNGLAAYLGIKEQRNSFEDEIKRQNPEPLSEKVSNYEEMMTNLGALGSERLEADRAPETERGQGIRDIIVCNTAPVLLAPIPGTDNGPALSLMGQLDGADPGTLTTGMNQKKLSNWLDQAADPTSFAVIDHPLERAYSAFEKHIFPPTGATYPKIRRRLKAQFDVPLPDDLTGWTTQQHAASFEAFLIFLKSNLAGQTSIRIDGQWDQQHRHIAGFSAVIPIANLVKSNKFSEFSADLAANLGISLHMPPTPPTSAIGLADIYSRRLENLARAAYAKDYRLLGFGDWDQYQAASDEVCSVRIA